MEKLTYTKAASYFKLPSSLILLLFCIVSFSTSTYAAADTTTFRIKVLQDSVYAGDTIDVEFYISTGTSGLNILNILNQFEFGVVTDTGLTRQDKTTFAFDYASLASFFGTSISNITSFFTLNPILGKLNIMAGSARAGKGDARVGKGQYIVQDNAAGRQSMKYSFTDASSKKLLGLLNLSNPVKTIEDSVIVLEKRSTGEMYARSSGYTTSEKRPVNAGDEIKVYPNPVTDYIRVDGKNISQYKLIAIDGTTTSTHIDSSEGLINIDVSKLNAGMYLLMLKVEENWNGHIVIKK